MLYFTVLIASDEKRVKAYVEQPYIITDEGYLDVLFKILVTGIIYSYINYNYTTTRKECRQTDGRLFSFILGPKRTWII